jgi:predicted dinucleotide-binding enzyme
VTRTPKDAAGHPGFVVFELPWEAVKGLMPTLGNLSGKPITAEQLQPCLPGARIVQAFNTPGAPDIVNTGQVGGTTTIALAAADATVQTWVARLVSELGLEPLDTRALAAASYLEGIMRLSFGYLLYSEGRSCEFNLRPVLK